MDEIDTIITKIFELNKELVNKATDLGIRANVQLAIQIGELSYYPHLNNSRDLKEKNKYKSYIYKT